MTTKYKWQCD